MLKKIKITKWTIMSFIVLNNAFNIALPFMALSVMSKEIAKDLDLSIVQIGILWGSASLLSIISSLLGGAVVDKLGARKILIFSSLFVGFFGVSRGFTWDFYSIVTVTTILGLVSPLIMLSNFKVFQDWFTSKELVFANGIMSTGMALGFLLGSQFSATVLSPLLGGWRGVLIAYSVVGFLLAFPWLFILNENRTAINIGEKSLSLKSSMVKVIRLKNVWLLGFALFGVNGAINGLLGYLPLYLRTIGWDVLKASTTMTLFHTVSMFFTIPIVLYSSKWFSRKHSTIIAGSTILVGIGLLAVLSGPWIWLAVILAGFSRDGFMALFFTQVSETDGVDASTVGTATGLTMMLNGIGSILAPPIGNYFSAISFSAPFGFWAALTFLGVLCLLAVGHPAIQVNKVRRSS
jgi:MFS family permease